MARFESLRIASAGATLAVRHYPGVGEPIVLLHGGPGMGDYFDSLPEVLSPPHRVVSYDQRGCGSSSCDGTFDVAKQVADLDSVRRHLAEDRIHIFLGQLSIAAPVLIVQGEYDVIRETNAVLAERFPRATNVRIDNAGHFPWVEQPATFSKTILDFYRKVASMELV